MRWTNRFFLFFSILNVFMVPSNCFANWIKLSGVDVHANFPEGREHGIFWVEGDYLHLVGGLGSNPKPYTPIFDHWTFDLKTDQAWTERSISGVLPRPVGRLVTLPQDGIIAFVGGDLNMQTINTPFLTSTLGQFNKDFIGHSFNELVLPVQLGGAFADATSKTIYSICGLLYFPLADKSGWSSQPDCSNIVAFHVDDTGLANHKVEYLQNIGSENPQGRFGFFYAYDRVDQRFIMFSGDTIGNATVDQETWELKITGSQYKWRKISVPNPPSGRRNGCGAYDEKYNAMYIWGGTKDMKTTEPGLFKLDLTKDQEAWSEVIIDSTKPEPEMRSSCSATFDGERRRIIYGFGNSPYYVRDLWAFQLPK